MNFKLMLRNLSERFDKNFHDKKFGAVIRLFTF